MNPIGRKTKQQQAPFEASKSEGFVPPEQMKQTLVVKRVYWGILLPTHMWVF